jgi:2-haloacid dehalogenase
VPSRTALIIFDVNETLSDMAPLGQRFADVGAAPHLAATWFAGLLRDGFALTVTEGRPEFGALAQESLVVVLARVLPAADVDDAAKHVYEGIAELDVHPDVVPGVRALAERGLRLVTLSVGGTQVADRLLEKAGLRDLFEATLTAADASCWKPHKTAYEYALDRCEVAADSALLVAVHPWDLEGAHHAGLRTAWVDRQADRYPSYFSAPDIVVDSIGGISDRL